MALTTSIMTPRINGDPIEVTGQVVWIKIGGTRVKAFLQYNGQYTARSLTHWASGAIMVSHDRVRSMQLRHHWTNGKVTDLSKLTALRAAKMVMAELVDSKGAEYVLSIINEATVINR